VEFVLVGGEVSREQSGYPLRAAATEMRDQQEDFGTLRHRLSVKKEGIRQVLRKKVLYLTLFGCTGMVQYL
jgi:hypothetical protein